MREQRRKRKRNGAKKAQHFPSLVTAYTAAVLALGKFGIQTLAVLSLGLLGILIVGGLVIIALKGK